MEDGCGALDGTGAKFDPSDLLEDLRERAISGVHLPLFAWISVREANRVFGTMGHSMAVKIEAVTGNTVRYFDPNFGEFAFNSWGGFKSWFHYYFRTSHYEKFMGRYFKLRYF